jgi:hypothetical protein
MLINLEHRRRREEKIRVSLAGTRQREVSTEPSCRTSVPA